MNVLLADDDPTIRLLLSTVVEQCGHAVVKAAADGQEAWKAYQTMRPTLLILDWEMPGLDGLEVCRLIRASDRGDEIFILVVTARDRREDLAAALDAGADDFLSKPVTPDMLRARLRIAERRIENTTARRSAEAALRRARYLAGIGETSLALQHEINNPLTALLSHASLLRAGMVDDGAKEEALATIVAQAKRIGEVVAKLRQLQNPRSVEYLGEARMLDIKPGSDPKPGS